MIRICSSGKPLTYVTNLMRKPVAVCQAQNAKQAATI